MKGAKLPTPARKIVPYGDWQFAASFYEIFPAPCLSAGAALEKSAFFLARLELFRRTGAYPSTRRETALSYGPWSGGTEKKYERLIRWSSSLL